MEGSGGGATLISMLAGREKLHAMVESACDYIDNEELDGVVGVAMLLIEVKGHVEGGGFTTVIPWCSDGRQWIQRAILDEASDVIRYSPVGEPQ